MGITFNISLYTLVIKMSIYWYSIGTLVMKMNFFWQGFCMNIYIINNFLSCMYVFTGVYKTLYISSKYMEPIPFDRYWTLRLFGKKI